MTTLSAWFPGRGWRAWAARLAAAAALLVAFGCGGLLAHMAVLARDLPDLEGLEDYRPPVTSRVFDAGGNLVARFYEERRTVVAVERIPAHVKHAFIAAEDEDYYRHKGVDLWAVVAASLNEVKVKLVGGARRGGSTITQQTAKTFLLSPERTYTRKVKEMLLARKIEQQFTKDQILHLYLNQIYFGNGAYGVEEAARTYFGVGVEKVSLGQAAVLASIPKSPSRINPFVDPARVRARRAYVLDQMAKNGFASAAEAQRAKDEPVRVHAEPPEYLDTAPYYAEHIRRILAKRYGDDEVNRGGLTVYAALDARLQKAATEALQDGLRALDKRQGFRGVVVRLDPDEAKAFGEALDDERARRFPAEETPEVKKPEVLDGRPIWDLSELVAADLQRDLRTGGKAAAADDEDEDDEPKKAAKSTARIRGVKTTKAKLGAIVGGVVKKIDAVEKEAWIDLGTTDAVLPMEGLSWARPFDPERKTDAPKTPGDVLKKGDVVLVRLVKVSTPKGKPPRLQAALEQEPKVEGAFVAVDPSSHRVLALVGGYDFRRSSFNRATQAKRQPGSAFKPFVYASGIELRLLSPVGFIDGPVHHLVTDAPRVYFDRWTGQKWQPKNSGGRFLGDISTRTCLTHSVNTCSIAIVERVGVDAVHDIAKKVRLMDDAKPWPKNLTLALGTGEVAPLDLVNAYSVFADEGRWAPPVLIEKVKKQNGEVLEEAKPERWQAISPATAYVMTDMMRSVVESGTATRAKELGRPVAGKTGTTDEARSVWFVGFTADVVAGAYVGFDDNTPLGRSESGGRAAVPIWLGFMKEAVKELPARDFKMPEGVVRRAIDPYTGLLASAEPAIPVIDEATADEMGIPPVLPRVVVSETFLAGTEPLLTADEAAPEPLEMREAGGGLGP